jgi:hypothetical protein
VRGEQGRDQEVTLTPEQFERRKGEHGNVMIMTAILAVGWSWPWVSASMVHVFT